MNVAPEPMTRWITRMMADITEEGSPDRFELFHTVDGGGERIDRVKIKDGDEAGDVAQQLYDSAVQDADTRENKYQRYTVALFRSESQSEPELIFPFRVQQRANANWTGGDTEQPTEKGERAQLMRMQNDGHSIMMRMAETFAGRMATENARLGASVRELEERIRKDAIEREDLADRRLDREVDRAARLQKEKFTGDIVGSLIPLLPLIASGLTSKLFAAKGTDKNGHESTAAKSLIPAHAEADSRSVLLREMFANMSEDEQTQLLGAIHPMKRMVLMQLAQALASANSDLERAAFDSGMQKFLKSLEGPEVMNILSVLDVTNRSRFMLIYQSYGKSEEESQAGTPDVLKDSPPAEAQS